MLPQQLRFDYRAAPQFFNTSHWINLPGAKNDPFLRSLSFRVQNSESPQLRWAIVVPKKLGNAVQRAKIKRLVRHTLIALFQHSPQDFEQPYNVVIFVRSRLESQSEVEQIITTFLSALKNVQATPGKE